MNIKLIIHYFIENAEGLCNDSGYFDIFIRLTMILGSTEDDRQFLINAEHELIFTRSMNDLKTLKQALMIGIFFKNSRLN